jgi:hypothetical protein
MAFNNSSNVDARGGNFFDIGRDQVNNLNFNVSLANSGANRTILRWLELNGLIPRPEDLSRPCSRCFV